MKKNKGLIAILFGLIGAQLVMYPLIQATRNSTRPGTSRSLEETVKNEHPKQDSMSRLYDEIYGLMESQNKERFEKWLSESPSLPRNSVSAITVEIYYAQKSSLPKIQELVGKYSVNNPSLRMDMADVFYWHALQLASDRSYSGSEVFIDLAKDFSGLTMKGSTNINTMVDIAYGQAKSSAELGYYYDAKKSIIFARRQAKLIGVDTREYETKIIEAAADRTKFSAAWGAFRKAGEGINFITDASSYLKLDINAPMQEVAGELLSSGRRYAKWGMLFTAGDAFDLGIGISKKLGDGWVKKFYDLKLEFNLQPEMGTTLKSG